jgi:hypothetical protein
VRFQKLMWRNMMRSTKSKKVSVLHYSIDLYKIVEQCGICEVFYLIFILNVGAFLYGNFFFLA